MARDQSANLLRDQPDLMPPLIAATILVKPRTGDAKTLLERLRSVWVVAERWGQFEDDESDDPNGGRETGTIDRSLEADELFGSLPDWFTRHLGSRRAIGYWFVDVEGCSWRWWSGSVVGRRLKIDISQTCDPVTLSPLMSVLEAAGGEIVWYGPWRKRVGGLFRLRRSNKS